MALNESALLASFHDPAVAGLFDDLFVLHGDLSGLDQSARGLVDSPTPLVGALLIQVLDLLPFLFGELDFGGEVFTAAARQRQTGDQGQSGQQRETQTLNLRHDNHFKQADGTENERQDDRVARCAYGSCVLSPPAIVPAAVQTSASTDSVTKRVLPSAMQTFTPAGW